MWENGVDTLKRVVKKRAGLLIGIVSFTKICASSIKSSAILHTDRAGSERQMKGETDVHELECRCPAEAQPAVLTEYSTVSRATVMGPSDSVSSDSQESSRTSLH